MKIAEIDVIYGTGDKPLKYRVHLTKEGKELLRFLPRSSAPRHPTPTRLDRLLQRQSVTIYIYKQNPARNYTLPVIPIDVLTT